MSENVRDEKRLKELQALPLDRKILITQTRIIEWYLKWNGAVYVSFSGGKDSTVLADMTARFCSQFGYKLYLLFVNTGLEYPEIQRFPKTFAEWLRATYSIDVQLDIVRPEMRFDEVLKTYGYPVISKEVAHKIHDATSARRNGNFDSYAERQFNGSYVSKNGKRSMVNIEKYKVLLDATFGISHKCCDVMKKQPSKHYEKETGRKPIIGTLTQESLLRRQKWLRNGCNAFNSKRPTSEPMSFWTDQDVLHYLKEFNIPYCSVYGDIREKDLSNSFDEQMSMFCCYGHRESGSSLETTGCDRTGCIFCGFSAHNANDNRFLRLKETHPRQYEYCINGGEYAWVGYFREKVRQNKVEFVNEDGSRMSHDEIESFVEQHRSDPRYTFKKLWQPNKQGLGLGHVFDELNKIYGENFIRYK
jgi:3'-phosphoadenosine 5'-phosphosulfate sulfotransferase (PAPS reductase)/FAD synthetase